MPLDGVHEPQGRVDGVVLRPRRCRRCWRSIPSDSVAAYAAQQLPALVGAAGRQEQPLVRGHRVARPRAEPRVAGDHVGSRRGATTNASAASASAASHRRRVSRRRPRPRCAGRGRRRSRSAAGGGGRASRSPAHARHLQRLAGVQLRGETARRARGPRRRSGPGPPPRGGGRPVYHCTGRLQPRAGEPVRVLRRPPRRRPARRAAVGPYACRSPCASRQVQSASRRERRPGRPGDQPMHHGERRRPCTMASSRSSTTSPIRQRHRGRPSTSSNAPSSGGPAGRSRRRPTRGCRAGRCAPVGSVTRVERDQADLPGGRRRAGDHEQTVVAAGAQPADRAHGVTAETVGDQPFPGWRPRSDRRTPADRTTMGERGCPCVDISPSVVRRNRQWRQCQGGTTSRQSMDT